MTTKPMKLGALSLNINTPDFNYGAMLHSWAFQQYVTRLDCIESAEVIDYIIPKLENKNRRYPFITTALNLRPRKTLRNLMRYPAYRSRLLRFEDFVRRNMVVSDKQYVNATLKDADLDYDVIVCESDVIWSPSQGKLNPAFFLAFDSMKDMKRIAYSPSLADAELGELEDELDELLQHVDYISCRESYGVDLLKKHTDKPVTHVMDPVLLLEPQDFDPITAPRLTDYPYLLLYLPVDNNDLLLQQAKTYAKKHGLLLIEISTKLSTKSDPEIIKVIGAGMEDFLSAIKYADMVFTNSFHAICFSVLFERQFYAFTRQYQKKVKDICATFGLESRYFDNDAFIEQPDVDYSVVRQQLRMRREQSRRWLQQALEG